jgi:PPIC-type PPIASE domain
MSSMESTNSHRIMGKRLGSVGPFLVVSGLLLIAATFWFGGSRSPAAQHSEARQAGSDGRVATRSLTCPRAPWRLADRSELRESLLSLSHILIRHADSEAKNVALSALDWETEMPSAARQRDEGLALARDLKARLEAGPDRWATLVREYSDDPVSREEAGRLGLFAASEFLLWPGILDCLAPAEEGGYVIAESAAGIHLFRRDKVPALEEFAAKRIVIGYQGAGFLKYVARGQVSQRTRTEALRLAQELRERARLESFDVLVRDYSEHRDAAQGGDIGVWSTREPPNFPRLLDAIVHTRVGEVTPVLDSELGFQIFLRIPVTERPRFAMESATFGFDAGSTDDARQSQAAALAQARAYLDAWRTGSRRPSDPRYRGNEGALEAWSSGRGPDAVEAALREIPVGNFLREPLRSDQTYLVALRVEPPLGAERRAARIWLPVPAEPDLEHFVATSPPQRVGRLLSAVEQDTEPAVRARCEELRLALVAQLETTATAVDRRQAWVVFQRDLRSAIKNQAALSYENTAKQRVRELLLNLTTKTL